MSQPADKWLLLVCTLVLASVLTGCGTDSPRLDSRAELMKSCFSQGGAYFEYEATSAGAHVWCVTSEGESIRVEGDGNHD